jgi:hypothetical protein
MVNTKGVFIKLELHITKTNEHFGDNRYVIKTNSLSNALDAAKTYVPFMIEDECLTQLQQSGVFKQDNYMFSCH